MYNSRTGTKTLWFYPSQSGWSSHLNTVEFIEAAQVDEVAKDKWGWNRKEDYSVTGRQRKEAKEAAEQVLWESRGAKECGFVEARRQGFWKNEM